MAMPQPWETMREIISGELRAYPDRYTSERDWVEQAGITSGAWSNWVTRNRATGALLSEKMARAFCGALGMRYDDLYELVHPPATPKAEKFPNRARAAAIMRSLGRSTAAINAVLSERAGDDPDTWYWIKRIESEEIRLAPLARGQSK